MEVRAGDTATYGDNVSENLHMTSKNEVKNNKFNFLNKQHLCNILFFFFSFFVWITCKCFCFRHPCFLSYKYTCNACNNLSFEMMEVTSTVWQNLPTKKSFLMGAFFKNFSNSNISCYALQVGDRGYPRDWGGEKKKESCHCLQASHYRSDVTTTLSHKSWHDSKRKRVGKRMKTKTKINVKCVTYQNSYWATMLTTSLPVPKTVVPLAKCTSCVQLLWVHHLETACWLQSQRKLHMSKGNKNK